MFKSGLGRDEFLSPAWFAGKPVPATHELRPDDKAVFFQPRQQDCQQLTNMTMDNPQPVWPDQHTGEPPLSVEALHLLVAERGDPTKALQSMIRLIQSRFQSNVCSHL
jgi:hypothetical protein